MLRKIILIVTIVAGLAAAALNFTVVKGKIDALTTDRNSQRDQKVQAQNELHTTKKKLADTQAALDQTKQDLVTAQNKEQKAENDLVAAQTQVQDLNGKLDKTTKQLNDTQDQLAAYKATGLSPEDVASLNKNLEKTENALAVEKDENLVLGHTVARLNNQIADLIGVTHVVTLPAGLKGTVMAVDPKWEFVVLNIGDDQGVLPNGELLVSRDGKLVAKVVVRSVQKDRSIANLVPGWQLGDIIEGDVVIPAHPAS